MNKTIIGGIVAGLILFIWQFLSWGLLDLHGSQMAHTPNQDAILECLAANLSEEGEYFIPRASSDASSEQQQAEMEARTGKPWALISYRKSLEHSMGMSMLRGLLIDIIAGILLCWILMRFVELDMKTTIMTSVAIGLIGYLTINYLDNIWFETSSMPQLIDAIVPWAAIGAWTGWYLRRE